MKTLPQAQEENEGDDESSHGYTVTQVVDDERDLVVHWILSLEHQQVKVSSDHYLPQLEHY